MLHIVRIALSFVWVVCTCWLLRMLPGILLHAEEELSCIQGRFSKDGHTVAMASVCVSIVTALRVSSFVEPEVLESILSWVKLFVAFHALLMSSAFDYRFQLIPNYIHVAIIAVRVVLAVPEMLLIDEGSMYLVSSVIGALACLTVLLLAKHLVGGGLGNGDIKLISSLAFLCGFYASVSVLLFSLLACGVVAFWLVRSGKRGREDPIPFGPFLFVGLVCAILLGQC